jgi:energy-coupling factor transporter transmembrane protein EcfT
MRSDVVTPTTATAEAAEPSDPYLARLVKLVPAEVLALYVALKVVTDGFPGVWALICLLLVLLVRTVGTKQAGKPIQWIAVGVASLSFVLWVYATGGHLLAWELPTSPEKVAKTAQGAVSAAIAVWTFVVPYFYKGD